MSKETSFDPFASLGKKTEVSNAERIKITRLFKRALQTPDGEKMLKYLASKTLERPTEPFSVPITQDQTIQYWMHRRFREGQNDIVAQILNEVNKIVEEEKNV